MAPRNPIADLLLRWFDRNRRDLPWRQTDDPWAILVSEVMLQQTRVDVVIPYYRRFLDRFPDPESLATAPEEDLLAHWSGLGYYRRARNLQGAARRIIEQHAGRFPREFEQILALPGVGRYTAGAVASIAFRQVCPVVDGNVARVLARLDHIPGDLRERRLSERLWARAEELLDDRRPGDFNQALMELGALICLPRAPRCPECPLGATCRARADDATGEIPTPRARPQTVSVRLAALVMQDPAGRLDPGSRARKRRVAMLRRATDGLMAGLFDLPAVEMRDAHDPRVQLTRFMRRQFGVTVHNLESLGTVRHTITHRRITAEVFRADLARLDRQEAIREPPPGYAADGIAPRADDSGLRSMPVEELERLGLSALARKMIALEKR